MSSFSAATVVFCILGYTLLIAEYIYKKTNQTQSPQENHNQLMKEINRHADHHDQL